MAFTLHVGVSVFGKKDNIELTFPARPSLPELVHRVQSVFTHETNAPFNIDQIRIYDEVLGRWVDLVREDQLHGFAQLYAFQPDTPQNCDSRGLLPAPRPVGGQVGYSTSQSPGGIYGGGAPSPQYGHGQYPVQGGQGYGDVINPRQAEIDAQKEAERHRLIAQHLSGQLQGGGVGSPQYPHGGFPASPLTPRQGTHQHQYPGPDPYGVNSPSQHSPIQVGSGGPGFAAPLPGVDPRQAEIDAQKEAERHRLIAQHLNSQLSGGGVGGYNPQGINHHPAPSPINPSPMGYMGSPATPGHGGYHDYDHKPHNMGVSPQFPPQMPPSPATPVHYGEGGPGGLSHNQAEIDAQKEAERHRLIAQHLSAQLGGGGVGAGHHHGGTPYNTPVHHTAHSHHPSPSHPVGPVPFSPDQNIHQQWANSPSQVPYQHPQSPMYHGHQTAMSSPHDESLKEAERHRLIAQHLNQQLSAR